MPRPRITELIARGVRCCPLTVVTGPPGAGKTMALAMWAEAGSWPVAWLSLDEHDNRPGVFWSYLVAALRRSGVALPRALASSGRGRTAERQFLVRLAEVSGRRDQDCHQRDDDPATSSLHAASSAAGRNGAATLAARS